MYRCLLHQMMDQVPHLERKVPNADRRAYRSTGWPVEVLQDLFRQTVQHLCRETRVNCYIDALDEGEDEDQVRGMVGFFYELAERAVLDGLPFYVCLASRYYPKISVSSFEELRLEDHKGHEADISNYVHNKLRLGSGRLKQQLASEINLRSRGVFLWVVLVVAILNKESDRGNQHLLLTRLREIPDGLLQLFQDLQSRDPSDNRFLPAIEWVLHAMVPLEPKELYIAILTSTGALTVENFAWFQQTMDAGTVDDFIISSSKGFLEVGAATQPHSGPHVAPSSDRRVQFIHETVREYFLVAFEFGDQSIELERAQVRRHANHKHCATEPRASTKRATVQAPMGPEIPNDRAVTSRIHPGSTPGLGSRSINDTIAFSHARLSRICQTYIRISHASDLQQKPRSTYSLTWNSDKRPFLWYALEEVLNHANAASKNGWPKNNLAKDFPWDEWIYSKSAIEYIPADHAYHRMYTWLQRMTYEAQPELVYDELASIAKRSQEEEGTAQSVLNACVDGLGSALHIAASSEYARDLTCLELLLDSGASVNKTCKNVGTPLHLAVVSRFHSTNAVGLLLAHGADPNAKDYHGNSPVHYAILARSFRLVETLVEYGADLNGRIGVHGNAAQTAGQVRNWQSMAWLASLGANV